MPMMRVVSGVVVRLLSGPAVRMTLETFTLMSFRFQNYYFHRQKHRHRRDLFQSLFQVLELEASLASSTTNIRAIFGFDFWKFYIFAKLVAQVLEYKPQQALLTQFSCLFHLLARV